MTLVSIIIAGFLGTSVMSLIMWLITKKGIANADMIRAIGSLLSDYESSFSTGIKIHYAVGILVAFIYTAFISLLAPTSLAGSLGTGTMIGLFHGVAFAFVLVVAVAEHHPIERFRNAGLEVAIAHLVGHVIYGFIVGLIVGITGARLFF